MKGEEMCTFSAMQPSSSGLTIWEKTFLDAGLESLFWVIPQLSHIPPFPPYLSLKLQLLQVRQQMLSVHL